jgi:hypothetical protein
MRKDTSSGSRCAGDPESTFTRTSRFNPGPHGRRFAQGIPGIPRQYNDAKGPCKGGIRFHPNETIDTIRALAAWMNWKCSLLDLPLGSGKGGAICNPKELSQGELERLSRAYIDQVGRIIGPEKTSRRWMSIPTPRSWPG